MLYQKIESAEELREAFAQKGRRDQFSREGFEALFDYLDEFINDVELDPIALCCEWTESSIEEAFGDFQVESMDELLDHVVVLELENDNILVGQ